MINELWLAFLGIYPKGPTMSIADELNLILNEIKAGAAKTVAFEQQVVALLTDIKTSLAQTTSPTADVQKIEMVPGVPTQH